MAILRTLGFLYLLTSLTVVSAVECNFRQAVDHLHQCLSRWKYGRVSSRQPLAYLTEGHLTKEICLRGSLDSVEQCVQEKVPQQCDTVRRHWQGTGGLFYYICNNYYKFAERHRECRTNQKLIKKLESCTSENHKRIKTGKDFCNSNDMYLRCVAESLVSVCDTEATKFFMRMFRAELEPEMTHLECPEVIIVILSPEQAPFHTEKSPCRLDVYNPDGSCSGGRGREEEGDEQDPGYLALSSAAQAIGSPGIITSLALVAVLLLILNLL